MECSISGKRPEHPVVSPKSGAIFEGRLIQEYIAEHHKDPITGDELQVSDLIEIRPSKYQPPRSGTLNSVPSLLSALQNEWDSVALELFQLKKQLDDARKELSTALYHHDAAMRVAAKAVRERDEARKALAELSMSISKGEAPIEDQEDVEVGEGSVPQNIVDEISSANNELFAIHKAQKNKVNIAICTQLSDVKQETLETKPFKKLAFANAKDDKIFVVSSSGITSVYDAKTQSYEKDETIPKITRATAIIKTEKHTIFGLANGQVQVDGSKIQVSKSSIVSLLQHPTLLNLLFSFDKVGQFSIIDIEQGKPVYTVQLNREIIGADIHKDGAIVAAACSDGDIILLDLRSGEVAQTLHQKAHMTTIAFGNNGFYLFGGYKVDDDYFLLVWDLRKQTSFKVPCNYPVERILSDKSAHLVVSLSGASLELAQYNKVGKDWIKRNVFDVELDGEIVDGIVVDDTTQDSLKIAVVTDTSNIATLNII